MSRAITRQDPPSGDGQEAYPHLAAPLTVRGFRLRNRIVMGSMHTRLEHHIHGGDRLAAFYAERARGGVALVITGGVAPCPEGLLEAGAPLLSTVSEARGFRPIIEAVHAAGALICLQILHAGRYAKHASLVGASDLPAPINPRPPRALDEAGVETTIAAFARCAALAVEAGFDGVEIMGSEGYLLNQFAAARTNTRTDRWGGSPENRRRFPVAVAEAVREAVGNALLIYRMSALDLVEGGADADETDAVARALQDAGVDILSTGIGWHEARIPTIAGIVPRAGFAFASERLRRSVTIPVGASNRINTPQDAERVIATGAADLVFLARPLLADSDFAAKAVAGQSSAIRPCIACNQACLDYIFTERSATCLVNPRAGREGELPRGLSSAPTSIAVVGGGAAGLAFAISAAERGHAVTLFERDRALGGQLRLAAAVAGKEEFAGYLEHCRAEIDRLGITLRLGREPDIQDILALSPGRVVIATGVEPRVPALPGLDHPMVATYTEILSGARRAGGRVVVMGAGGIGFDVAHFLTSPDPVPDDFLARWGVDRTLSTAGGLTTPVRSEPRRHVTVVQRDGGRPGRRLGVSTGWILRAELQRAGVQFVSDCAYRRIDDRGLHVSRDGGDAVLPADTVVICIGQERHDPLSERLRVAGVSVDVIGGAAADTALDAVRAIREAVELSCRI